MSDARAVTNFARNAVAAVLIGNWVGELDRGRVDRVLDGSHPFDEATMLDDDEPADEPAASAPSPEKTPAAARA